MVISAHVSILVAISDKVPEKMAPPCIFFYSRNLLPSIPDSFVFCNFRRHRRLYIYFLPYNLCQNIMVIWHATRENRLPVRYNTLTAVLQFRMILCLQQNPIGI